MVRSLAPASGRFAGLTLAALAVVILASVVSDSLFLLFFTVPALATLGGYTLFIRFSGGVVRTGLVIGAASAAAYLIGKATNAVAAEYIGQLLSTSAAESLHHLVETFVRPFIREQIFAVFIIAINIAFVVMAVRHALRSRRQPQERVDPMLILGGTFMLSCVIVTVAAVSSGVYISILTTRYLLPLSFFPLFYFALALAVRARGTMGERPLAGLVVPTVLLVTAGVLAGITLVQNPGRMTLKGLLPMSPRLACFNNERPVIGFGSYWQAKPLAFFSNNQVQVAELTPAGDPFLWINSNRVYSENLYHPGEPVVFRFIIMDGLNKEAIAAKFGQPESVQKCRGTEIWWYKNRDDLALAAFTWNFYAMMPAHARRYTVGDRVDFSTKGNSHLYKKSGWYGVEPLGTWSKGDAAVLEFMLTEAPMSDLVMEVDAFPFLRPQHPWQGVDVVVNGEPVTAWIFSGVPGEGDLKTRIPAAVVNRQRPLRIEFRIANSFSPQSIGESTDPRQLGLSIRSLRLVEAPARP